MDKNGKNKQNRQVEVTQFAYVTLNLSIFNILRHFLTCSFFFHLIF
jgi:hypothetical protein